MPVQPRPRLVPPTAPVSTETPRQAPAPSRSDRAFVGVLAAIGAILAVRLLLLLAIVGGFVLAVMALTGGTYQAAGVLIAYAVLIVLPLVWLESRPKQ